MAGTVEFLVLMVFMMLALSSLVWYVWRCWSPCHCYCSWYCPLVRVVSVGVIVGGVVVGGDFGVVAVVGVDGTVGIDIVGIAFIISNVDVGMLFAWRVLLFP